jgi:prepilin-type N-terminal cleavage/methylation domain-containing protein
MNTRRFTLIELLVVVAVIAVLAALLLPALAKARKRTLRVVCASQLKQQGYAQAMYAEENDAWLIPAAWSGTGPAWSNLDSYRPYFILTAYWKTLQQNFGITPQLLVCPDGICYDMSSGLSWSGYQFHSDWVLQVGNSTAIYPPNKRID